MLLYHRRVSSKNEPIKHGKMSRFNALLLTSDTGEEEMNSDVASESLLYVCLFPTICAYKVA
jgi:hypothetical protein